MAEKIQSSMNLRIKEKLPVVLPHNYTLEMTVGTIMLGFGYDVAGSFLWRATTSSAPTAIVRFEAEGFRMQLKKAGHSILVVLLPRMSYQSVPLTWWECQFSDATFKSLLSKKQRESKDGYTGDYSYFVSVPKKLLWLIQTKTKLSVYEVPVGKVEAELKRVVYEVPVGKNVYEVPVGKVEAELKRVVYEVPVVYRKKRNVYEVPVGKVEAELKRVGTIESHLLSDHKFIGHHGGRLMFALGKINRTDEYTIGAWNVTTKELELSRVEVPSALFEELSCPDRYASKLPVILGDEAYFHLAGGVLVAIDLNEMTSRQIGKLPQDFLREEIPGSLEELERYAHYAQYYEMRFLTRFLADPTIIDESKSTITFSGEDFLNNRKLCYTFWYGLPSLMTLSYYSLPDLENRECLKTVLCNFT